MKLATIICIVLLILGCSNNRSSHSFLQLDYNVNSEVELGKLLFFDSILSESNTISCANCHNPQFAYADNNTISKGVNNQLGNRNTPSVMNVLSRIAFFHDGRALTLQEQALGPITNENEMNSDYNTIVKRIQNNDFYKLKFQELYQTSPDSALILDALAAFQNSLESDGSSDFDLWMNDEDTTKLSIQAKRGRAIFMEKGKCFDCHFGPDFTGDEYRNIGLYDREKLNDKGRFDVTQDSLDIGKFKVPGLRNVALTSPYMHNGMFKSLEEVIEYYNDPSSIVSTPINIDTLMLNPLNLTAIEKEDLKQFLISLTDKNIPYKN